MQHRQNDAFSAKWLMGSKVVQVIQEIFQTFKAFKRTLRTFTILISSLAPKASMASREIGMRYQPLSESERYDSKFIDIQP